MSALRTWLWRRVRRRKMRRYRLRLRRETLQVMCILVTPSVTLGHEVRCNLCVTSLSTCSGTLCLITTTENQHMQKNFSAIRQKTRYIPFSNVRGNLRENSSFFHIFAT